MFNVTTQSTWPTPVSLVSPVLQTVWHCHPCMFPVSPVYYLFAFVTRLNCLTDCLTLSHVHVTDSPVCYPSHPYVIHLTCLIRLSDTVSSVCYLSHLHVTDSSLCYLSHLCCASLTDFRQRRATCTPKPETQLRPRVAIWGRQRTQPSNRPDERPPNTHSVSWSAALPQIHGSHWVKSIIVSPKLWRHLKLY